MSRRWIRWPLAVVALAGVVYLAIWGATVFFGARLVPAAWLPSSERIEISMSHEVTVADGWESGHSWSLTSQVSEGRQCLQSYVDGLQNVRGCTTLTDPGFRPQTVDFAESGSLLTFGTVPERAELVELTSPDGRSERVRVLRHPEVPIPLFTAVTPRPDGAVGLQIRYIDAQGQQLPT
ncbi:hypothetical protein GIY23_15580 [Allosaccharopolyspora coralli]|uniref:DUF1850 domain-containing protein n=1 Tax=Allosaccharopolyspora coralli TaxID=2665642 RepID=A0A5Q3QBK3_9PSEU|nr:hypothetical protein [Allosaccharopolyspora coralli]QGK70746.1 hypothetical protein GIY23_15580 [Allosaccharopolyspora coralli]